MARGAPVPGRSFGSSPRVRSDPRAGERRAQSSPEPPLSPRAEPFRGPYRGEGDEGHQPGEAKGVIVGADLSPLKDGQRQGLGPTRYAPGHQDGGSKLSERPREGQNGARRQPSP